MSLDDERRALVENFAQLERRLDGHEREIIMLEKVPDTLQTLDKRLDTICRQLTDGERRMADIERALAANTVITTSVRDAQIAGRVLTSVVKWLSSMILAVGVIGGVIWSAMHNGQIPPGAGK